MFSLLLNENFVARQAFDVTNVIDTVRQAFPGKPSALYARGHNTSLAATYVLGGRSDLKFYVLENGFLSYRQFYARPRSLEKSFELKRDDRDRTTAFDREIPFAYVPFAALLSFDLPDIFAKSQARGFIVNPIDGDWSYMTEAAARKVAPAEVQLATGAAVDTKLRKFLIANN
jgi:hypothetical protein